MPGFLAALAPAAITAAGSIIGGRMAGKSAKPRESKLQRTQRHLIDDLKKSIQGRGKYSDLFKTDTKAFEKSFLMPAQSMFRNQIAPQIQQQYIQSGQQRGTGLDDQLLRAGVDLDSMLNQYLYQFKQDALNRKQGALNSILGAGPGAPSGASGGDLTRGAIGGYLQSQGFSDLIKQVFPQPAAPAAPPARKGFEKT